MKSFLLHTLKHKKEYKNTQENTKIDIDQIKRRTANLKKLSAEIELEITRISRLENENGFILVLCPYEFYARSQGGAIRTNNVIKALLDQNQVVSISYTWTEIDSGFRVLMVEEKWMHIDIYHQGALGGWSKLGDFHYLNWYTPEMLLAARTASKILNIKHLWLEYSFMSMYRHIAHEFGVPDTINLHNIEWKLTQELNRNLSFNYSEPYGHWVAGKIIEEDAILNAKNIITTTKLDEIYCKSIKNTETGNKILVAPNVIKLSPIEIEPVSHNDILEIIFVGDCQYQPNIEGLNWFLNELGKIEKNKLNKVKFNIIGKGSEILNQAIMKLNLSNIIEVHGFVEDLDLHYKKATASLIPLISGGGSRLKAYEAIQFGKYILSTEKGTEGIEFNQISEYIFKFSNHIDFITQLDSLNTHSKNKSTEKMQEAYSIWYRKEQEQFKNSINEVAK